MLYRLTLETLSCRVCLVLKARLVHLERKWVCESKLYTPAAIVFVITGGVFLP